jgi:hypothetical protein
MTNRSEKKLLLCCRATALAMLFALSFVSLSYSSTPKSALINAPKTKQNASTTSAYELLQEHAIGGPQRILYSKLGLRMESPNTGLVILLPAPFTHAYWTNPKKKLCYRIEINKSMSKMRSLKYVLDTTSEFTELKWEPPADTTFMGYPAQLYAKHTPKKSWCKYWVLKEPHVTPAIVKQVCAFSGTLPELGGLPVQWHQYVQKADMFNEIDDNAKPELRKFFVTNSIKQLLVPVSTFTCPSDYKFTNDRNEVMSSSVGFGSYKDLLKSPDFLFQSSSKKINAGQKKDATAKGSK